ncbi:MAG TPA: baseplate J/gp47 family protein [Gemmatimonadaceae bacterium]|nr:baseplate J/gp47 family protein [Gemmatimonadaceae bacterium]
MATELFQPSQAELLAMFLSDYRLAAADAGLDEPPTGPASDPYMIGTAVANIGLLIFTNINQAESAGNALTATGDDLDAIREAEQLPEVLPSRATGKLIITVLGATTIYNGQEFTLPNGLRGRVVGNVLNPPDQSEIDVETVDTGSKTNLAGGSKVRFAPAPPNVEEQAIVSSSFPLTGGTDGETDGRKRDRILNARRNRPAGGNWSQLREWALEALPSAQDCYVYPALGGPASAKVTPIRSMDASVFDFSRECDAVQLQAVRSYIQAKMPGQNEVVIQSPSNNPCDVAVLVTLPDSALAGGNGKGWTDAAPWPLLEVADGGAVLVTATSSDFLTVTLSANTAVTPIAGISHVAWWSSAERKFYTRLVTAVSGSAGAWVLTLESPLIDATGAGPQVSDYVCPAAANLAAYGDVWLQLLNGFGPGEHTTDSSRLPRAKRHPYVTDEDPTDITNATLAQWSNGWRDSSGETVHAGFPEITAFSLSVASQTTPSIPALVSFRQFVLTPRKFGIYKL